MSPFGQLVVQSFPFIEGTSFLQDSGSDLPHLCDVKIHMTSPIPVTGTGNYLKTSLVRGVMRFRFLPFPPREGELLLSPSLVFFLRIYSPSPMLTLPQTWRSTVLLSMQECLAAFFFLLSSKVSFLPRREDETLPCALLEMRRGLFSSR